MQAAKTTLNLTKYFLTLPPTRQIIGAILLITLFFGGLTGWQLSDDANIWALITGAATALITIALPSLLTGLILVLLRHRVTMQRGLMVSFSSVFIYLVFIFGAVFLSKFIPILENLFFIGFGLAFLLWFVVLKFAFGLNRSSWIFAFSQMIFHALSLITATTLFAGGVSDLLTRIILASFVFVSVLYAILFFISRPLKKNLGVSSADALSMFASQWIYGEKDLEGAFDELGEYANTWIGICKFKTKHGIMQWIIPYFHFGPFGNLGGSQFSYKIEKKLSYKKSSTFVFHGTATHDLDPVSSRSIHHIIDICKSGLNEIKIAPVRYSLRVGKKSTSTCYLLSLNDDNITSFSRAPKSTEDINLAVGWALMERARSEKGDSLAIDCHNCETGELDYIESGSPIAFDMLDALNDAISKKTMLTDMVLGWHCSGRVDIASVASGGIKVACFGSGKNNISFYILIDSNSITGNTRQKILKSMYTKFRNAKVIEIFTSDTHELNAVKGVFNPAGVEDANKLEATILDCALKAYEKLSPCEYGMIKKRIELKVLGPYQSAEIVSTLNAVFSLLKIVAPVGFIVSIGVLFWILTKV